MPSSAELVCVDPKQVAYFWPHVEPLLRPAIQNVGLSDFDDIATDILNGDALVWIAFNGKIKAAASTILQKVGDARICVLTACGGEDMHDWLPLLARIEDYAKAEECNCLRIYGRDGWQRVLDGYERKAVVLEKAL